MSTYSYENQLCKTLDLEDEMDWESDEYFEHRWELLERGNEVGLCLSHQPIGAHTKKGNYGLLEYETKYAIFYYNIDDDYGFDEFQDYFMLTYCIKAKDKDKAFATTDIINTHYKCWVDSVDRESNEITLSNGHGQLLKLTKREFRAYAWQYMCGGYKFGFPTF